MNEWTVVTVIVVLVGLIFTVGTPILKLNSTMAKLIERIENLSSNLTTFKDQNHDAHKRLWNKNDEQDETISNHEKRISIIESHNLK